MIVAALPRPAPRSGTKSRTACNALGSLLSGGQQQRLTIARALSQEPDLLMLDEFSIAVDPVTTMRIEDVLKELRQEVTIILVTNLVQQARRLADRTAFFLGRGVRGDRDHRGSVHRRGEGCSAPATMWRDDLADALRSEPALKCQRRTQ